MPSAPDKSTTQQVVQRFQIALVQFQFLHLISCRLIELISESLGYIQLAGTLPLAGVSIFGLFDFGFCCEVPFADSYDPLYRVQLGSFLLTEPSNGWNLQRSLVRDLCSLVEERASWTRSHPYPLQPKPPAHRYPEHQREKLSSDRCSTTD